MLLVLTPPQKRNNKRFVNSPQLHASVFECFRRFSRNFKRILIANPSWLPSLSLCKAQRREISEDQDLKIMRNESESRGKKRHKNVINILLLWNPHFCSLLPVFSASRHVLTCLLFEGYLSPLCTNTSSSLETELKCYSCYTIMQSGIYWLHKLNIFTA